MLKSVGAEKPKQDLRGRLGELLLTRPVYDAWRYANNAEAWLLYRRERAKLELTSSERAVVQQLHRDGIAIVALNDLIDAPSFSELQAWADALLASPPVQSRISAIHGGARPTAKSGKYFVVRPLGEYPVLDVHSAIVRAALSGPVLRIVSNYLGLLPRISAMDLWYHVATSEPEAFSQRWHRDPEDRALVKTFLYLHDCNDVANGPFCYVPGSQHTRLVEHVVGRDNYPDDGVVDRLFPPDTHKICTGRAGTLILCDTTGLHKGGHAVAGSRYLFNTVYTSNASEPIARGWRPCEFVGSPDSLDLAARYATEFLRPIARRSRLTRLLGGAA